ncbi:MAG: hypothetical protein E7614_04375 [Ruminococcaceae bacterium]|nr:hypothetical protein [Oscillospiraceae bacterium]
MLTKLFKNGRIRICAILSAFLIVCSLISSFPTVQADGLTGEGPVISNNYLRGIKEEQKCSQFKKLYTEKNHGSKYNLYAYGGSYIGTSNVSHIVSTGDYIRDGKGKAYTIIVTGDINGDGSVNISDTASIKLHFGKKMLLDEIPFQAADTDNNGRVTATDYLKIKYHIQMKYNIYDDESFEPDQSSEQSGVNDEESGWTSGWA